jgi:uncharacterized membrane protein
MTDIISDREDPSFRAVLTPNTALSARGFWVLMAMIALVNLVVGGLFLAIGAWPVLAFCGLDVLAIYVAFKINYRSLQRSETIEIAPGTVRLTRIDPKGCREEMSLQTYWARVSFNEQPSGHTELKLISHGRAHPVGAFLSDDERRELASVLAEELRIARASGGAT